jgi:hypothetical protein
MARKPSVNLKVVPPVPGPVAIEPPGKLGDVGLSLWRDIVSCYEFSDRASYETLFQACAAADRAAKLRDLIDEAGEVVWIKGVVRDHPALKHEIANRSFVVRTLARLGLDLEPVRAGPGRPPRGIGITWKDLDNAD